MAIHISKIRLTTDPLQIPLPIYSDETGAVLDFVGVVRGSENGKKIAGLDYEAYSEMAEAKLEQIIGETTGKYPIHEIILQHRIGFVPAGEPSLFIRVTAGHRGEAFDASREMIERLKVEVPIWKNIPAESL